MRRWPQLTAERLQRTDPPAQATAGLRPYSWEQFLDANMGPGKPPVFNVGGWHLYDDLKLPGPVGFSQLKVPIGLTHQLHRDSGATDPDGFFRLAQAARRELDAFAARGLPGRRKYPGDTWEDHVSVQVSGLAAGSCWAPRLGSRERRMGGLNGCPSAGVEVEAGVRRGDDGAVGAGAAARGAARGG